MRSSPRRLAPALLALVLAAAPALSKDTSTRPSRKPEKGCAWEKLSDSSVGLEAWVQRCDFGFRKIDFLFQGNALAIRYSDGGSPDAVIDVLNLGSGETPEMGIRRLFDERTDESLVFRCRLVPYRDGKPPAGVKRFTFEPDAAYAAELKRRADPNEVPPPPCGDWGAAPDGIQYWEAQPSKGARRVLFVRAGQDTPLFDERTLRLLP